MDYRRSFQPGGTFFFTVVTHRRRPLFESNHAFSLLQEVVRETRKAQPFTMMAWVVLRDHLHMIWTLPPGDSDYSGRWSRIKSQFTRRWLADGGAEWSVSKGKRRDDRRGIWQSKFYEHTVRDDDDLCALIEYIHYNPVKHGLVATPIDWLRSSFHEYVKRGVYEADWGTSAELAQRRAPYDHLE